MREYWHGVGRRLREGAKEKGARVGARRNHQASKELA